MPLYIMVDLDNEIKQKLYEKQQILKHNCTGDFEDPSAFHVTIKYLSDEDKDLNLAISIMESLDKVRYKKFTILAKDFHAFDQNTYWIGLNNSWDLYKIKYNINSFSQELNYEHKPEKFKNYTPHITMGYNIRELSYFKKEFTGIPIIVDNISLWQSYKVNDIYMHNCLYRVNLR